MKLLLAACLFVFASAEDAPSAERNPGGNSSLAERSIGYHQRQGVPNAERLKIIEAVNARISNGYSSFSGEHPYMAGLLVSLTTGQTSMCGGTLLNSWRVLTAASCWNDGYSQGTNILVVCEHVQQGTNHYLRFDKPQMLAKEHRFLPRMLGEAIEIKKHPNFNREDGWSVSPAWDPVVLGSVYLYSGGTRVSASQIYTHPYFNPYTAANDIAMLNIPYVGTSSLVKPITLPYGSYLYYSFNEWNGEVSGYGRTSEGSSITSSQSLRDVFLKIISNSQCQVYYGNAITSTIICTSGAGSKGPCGGDMGGPLFLRKFDGTNDMLVGVVSFGSASGCQAGHPSAYTRVTEYITWIRSRM